MFVKVTKTVMMTPTLIGIMSDVRIVQQHIVNISSFNLYFPGGRVFGTLVRTGHASTAAGCHKTCFKIR